MPMKLPDDMEREIERLDDYDGAVDALVGIHGIDPARAANLAIDIIERERGDDYFQAIVFSYLYSWDRRKSIDLIRANSMRCSAFLFSVMVDKIVDDVGIYCEDQVLRDIVPFIYEAIIDRRADEFGDRQSSLDDFMSAYKFLIPVKD